MEAVEITHEPVRLENDIDIPGSFRVKIGQDCIGDIGFGYRTRSQILA